MNTRQRVNLISRLRQGRVAQDKIDKLLSLPDKEIYKLYKISNNDLFISEVAKILNTNIEKNSFYLETLKQYKKKFSEEEYEQAERIIKDCNQQYNARCAIIALKNDLLKQYNLNIKSAYIISRAKKELNAEYILRILNVPRLLEFNLAMPMAELMAGTNNKEEYLNIIRTILIDKEIYLEVKDIINKVTIYLRRTLITVPGHEEEVTDLLNVFGEILNKPLIIMPIKEDKKRKR